MKVCGVGRRFPAAKRRRSCKKLSRGRAPCQGRKGRGTDAPLRVRPGTRGRERRFGCGANLGVDSACGLGLCIMHVQVSGSERIKVHKTPRRASASAGERLRDLIGNPVQSGSGPAAVDPFATILLHATGLFREGRESRGEPEDLPERRFARFGPVERGARGSLRLGAWPAGCDEDEKRYPPPSLHGGGYFFPFAPAQPGLRASSSYSAVRARATRRIRA